MRHYLERIVSPAVLTAFAVPVIVLLAVMTFGFGISPFALADTLAVRVFFGILLVLLVVRTVLSVLAKRYASALAAIGVILILLQGMVLYGFRFSGSIDLGEGEGRGISTTHHAGPWVNPLSVPLTMVKIDGGTPESCTVVLDGEEQTVKRDQPFYWDGLRLRVTDVLEAPLFILSNAEGRELEGGYIKLALGGASPEFFQFSIVPHRFYVSLPGQDFLRWKQAKDGWKRVESGKTKHAADPEVKALHLRIIRGKLTVYDGLIEEGGAAEFDGVTLTFAASAPWARIEVEDVQRFFLFFIGLMAVIAGGALGAYQRRAA